MAHEMVAQNMLRTYEEKYVLLEQEKSFSVTKCLQQIEIPDFLHMWGLILSYHLPSHIRSTTLSV